MNLNFFETFMLGLAVSSVICFVVGTVAAAVYAWWETSPNGFVQNFALGAFVTSSFATAIWFVLFVFGGK